MESNGDQNESVVSSYLAHGHRFTENFFRTSGTLPTRSHVKSYNLKVLLHIAKGAVWTGSKGWMVWGRFRRLDGGAAWTILKIGRVVSLNGKQVWTVVERL